MLRVPVHKIEAGMVLARPIPLPSEPRRYLLQRDFEIPLDLAPRLAQLGVAEVWIRYRSLEFLEDLIDERHGERQREIYSHVRRNFEAIMDRPSAQLDVSQFEGSISSLFEFLKQSRTGNVLLQKLDAFDNYLMSHSTNVCYLSLLLGLRIERYLIEERRFKTPREAKDVRELGLGCLLHDVGKMRIPGSILNKPGKLTDDEMEEMKRHPQYGYEMVRGRVPATAAQVVLNHHQRYNGQGYPDRFDVRSGEPLPPMQGKQIPIFCRIATVCDVYDAATAERVYSPAKPPVQALYEMKTWCRGFFDPVIERAFYEIIPPFPIGKIVTLSNGCEGVVVDFNPRLPLRPKVQLLRDARGAAFANPQEEEIDLAAAAELQIAMIDGTDVRPFQTPIEECALAAV